MKKLGLFMCAVAMVGMCMTSCKDDSKGNDPVIDPGKNLTSGLYVFGPATGIASLDDANAAVLGMAAGINEVDGAVREGMYEKYIVLEGGKEFQFGWKQGDKITFYGGTLAAQKLPTDNAELDGYFGALQENVTMTVPTTGFYHIILDFCTASQLPGGPQIVVVPVVFGVRGAMNSWGFTGDETPQVVAGQTEITWKWQDQEMAAGGEFKFAHNDCWKINLDSAELVKANSNLGGNLEGEAVNDLVPNGANIKVEKAGLYDITLTYKLAKGEMKNSFKATVVLTKESSLPTEMYMIGNVFGDWKWESNDVVALTPVHSHPGQFWCTRYFTADNEFKFCAKREWNGDFCTLATVNGQDYFETPGNNKMKAAGLYTIIIDMKENVMTVKPAAIFGMGDCFGNWDEGKNASNVAEDGTVTFTVTADGNLRMYSDINNEGNWWQSEFNVFDGKIVYRGADGDQAAVAATAGATVELDFNKGTGVIK